MDRTVAINAQKEISDAAKKIIAKNNWKLIKVSGRYSPGDKLTVSFSLLIPSEAKENVKKLPITQELVSAGLALPGSFLWHRWDDGNFYVVKILEARRLKYLFEWSGEEELGMFTAKFSSFQAEHPVTKRSAKI